MKPPNLSCGLRWNEIASTQGAQTTFVLHNKQFIAQMESELNLSTPSIMFIPTILTDVSGF
ncbi:MULTISPECIES: hypothetical protein [unclassified Paenibacillus]|uniref:hypothetical protein n=1 Tax=unclassified Paenibacillus TaxID=185978 RepID=UPI003637F525